VVDVYHFSECAENFGFPFPTGLLEKMEKFTAIINHTEESDLFRKAREMTDEEWNLTRLKYCRMIIDYDKNVRDSSNNRELDVENECVPLQVYFNPSTGFNTPSSAMSRDHLIDDFDSVSSHSETESETVDHSYHEGAGDSKRYVKNILDFIVNRQHESSHRMVVFGAAASGKTFLLRMIVS
jgi:hypothetical protein